MARKTIKIEALVDEVNHRNKVSTCSSDTREGWNAIASNFLMETGNYLGFHYLEWDDLGDTAKEERQKPGIVTEGGALIFPDESRIAFFQTI